MLRFSWLTYLLLLSFAVTACQNTATNIDATSVSNTYNRVLSTGNIRCGYLTYPPYCMKNANTKEMTGIFVEAAERIGKKLGLKITWAEEVGYESIFEGLRSNRFDIFAAGLWPNAERAKVGDFSRPLFYSAVKAYGRSDEKRFNNLSNINSSLVKIAVIDGAMEDSIAKNDFPLAKRLSLTQLSPFSQNLLNVATKKADVTFAEPGIVNLFLKNNPGSLKELAPKQPLRIFGNCFVFKVGQTEFKDMINTVIEEMLNSREFDRILKKYEPAPNSVYRVAAPYKIPDNYKR